MTMKLTTIVVAYDGTEPARAALERASGLAEVFGSTVVVATVAEPVVAGGAASSTAVPLALPETETKTATELPAREAWQRLLEEAQSYLSARGIRVEGALPVGRPSDQIVEVAQEHEADLIVLGTHKPGLLERVFEGSVSRDVARKAQCDVLIVHPGRRS
jgi:nucleotide-binding universal stress UspA family protein